MGKYMKASMIFIFILIFVVACGSNGNNDKENADRNGQENNESNENAEDYSMENVEIDQGDGSNVPVVTMTMENGGEVKMELYPEIAPTSVNNFLALAYHGYYDGLTFHRVIPDFMIQGGDPVGNGTGGPGYYIKGEFTDNGFENDLIHERGVLSMARSMHPDSAGSQFFIMVADSPHLDGQYASFGKVIEGMDVVDEIVSVDRDIGNGDKPYEDQVIEKMTVEFNGFEPGEIEKVDI